MDTTKRKVTGINRTILTVVTIGWFVLTTRCGFTDVVRAWVGVDANDGCVLTSFLRITEVIGAHITVFTRDVIVETPEFWQASVNRTCILIVAVDGCIQASLAGVTNVDRTETFVVTILWRMETETCLGVA